MTFYDNVYVFEIDKTRISSVTHRILV